MKETGKMQSFVEQNIVEHKLTFAEEAILKSEYESEEGETKDKSSEILLLNN
jgi:hypothetical protein